MYALRSLMNIKLMSIIIILLLASVSRGLSATTYYVRTDGSDSCKGLTDAAGSSGDCAYRNIQAGVNAAQAGDTVIVHSGTYGSFSSTRSGSEGNLITIQAATGETVSVPNITIAYDYIVIRGFTFTNPGYPEQSAAVRLTGSNNQILYNTFYGQCNPMTAGEGSCIGLSTQGAYNLISYNTFDGRNNGSNTSFGIIFYVGTKSTYNTFSYNLIKNVSAPGRIWELYGAYHHITNNEVANCQGSPTSVDHPDIFQVFGTAGAHDMLIENNYFHDFSGQIGNLGIDGNDSLWYNWTFRNNIFANMQELFIYFPIEVYNNTFYRCALNNGVVLQSSYRQGHTTNRNNAFIACGTAANNGWYGGPNDSDYNFVSNTATGGTKSGFSEAHGVNGGNPQLSASSSNCSSTTCNFHVGATSALIDKGVTLSTFKVDKDNNIRQQGSAWDIGAYEYVSGGGGVPITHTITPSVGPNGKISPNTPQAVNDGTMQQFIVTPNAGFTASVGGTCGGSLVGTTYTTKAITTDCTVSAIFTATTSGTRPSPPPAVTVE